MNVQVKELPKSKVELTIEVSPDELLEYSKKAALQLSISQKIKGFRPGNAPPKVIEQRLGKERLFQEAVDVAVKESYIQAIREQELETIAPPKIEVLKVAPNNPLVFRAEASVLPRVKLGDYLAQKIKKESIEVKDLEIDSALQTLRRSRAKYNNVSRPIQKGDRVEIDFNSKVAGVAIEGGTSKQHPLVVGEGHFMPGFEEKLLGMKEGEDKSFSLKAPQDYYRKELAGKPVDFKVKIDLVQKVELPVADDNFAKKISNLASLTELRQSIKDGLGEEKKKREQEKTRLKIIEQIVEETPFEIPELLISQELEKMEGELTGSLKRINLDKDSYLAHIKRSLDDLKKEWRPQAEKRVRSALVLKEIGKKEGIIVAEEEVETRANEILRTMPDASQIKQINLDSFKNHIRALLFNEKVFEFLEDKIVK